MYILLFSIGLLSLSCGREDAVLRRWKWEGRFRSGNPAIRLRIRFGFAEYRGERAARTEISWEEERINRVESYSEKDVKYTILANAGLTIISNTVVFLETPGGNPLAVSYRIRSAFRSTMAYRALLRKRLDELYVKHFGAAASGRTKSVEEQLKTTWKGELASLPDKDFLWRLEKGAWILSGRDQDKKVSERMPVADHPVFPGVLLRRLRAMGSGKLKEKVELLVPWYSGSVEPFLLTASGLTNGFACTLQNPTNAGLSCTVSFTTGLRPRSVRAGSVRILPVAASPVR